MSSRLAIDSRRTITVRQKQRVDLTLLAGATGVLSALTLVYARESVWRLALGLAFGAVGGLVVAWSVKSRRRVVVPERTVSRYVIRATAWAALTTVALVVIELMIGATVGFSAGVLAGALTERVASRWRLDARWHLDA